MSQAQAQPAPPPVAQAPTTAAAPPATASCALHRQPRPQPTPTASGMDTPSRLRLLSLGVVVAGVLTGMVGALVFSALAYSLARAEADTNQLIRVQQIQTNLLIADATATNAFLVGGLEPPAQRAQYDAALTATGRADRAGGAGPAGRRGRPGRAEPAGARLRRRDRAGPRQQPAGPADRVAVPAVGQCPAPRGRPAHRRQPGLGQRRPGRGPDGGLDRTGLRDLRRPGPGCLHRRPGLARQPVPPHLQLRHAPGRVGAAAGPAGRRRGAAGQPERAVGSIQHRQLRRRQHGGQRPDRGQQRQVQREPHLDRPGSGAAFETAWKDSADTGDRRPGPARRCRPDRRVERLRDVHTEIRALDDGGDWDKAVALATGTGEDSANTAFNAFDARLAETLDQASQAGRRRSLRAAARTDHRRVLALLGGLAAALLGRYGVAARLREYR